MKKLLYFGILFFNVLTVYSQDLQISGGNNYSVAICGNSQVFAWGQNFAGQVTGITTSAGTFSTPVTVAGLPVTMRQVDAGSGAHALGVDCNGQVWTWGLDNCGQSGRRVTAIASGFNHPSTYVYNSNCSNGNEWQPSGTVAGIGKGLTYGPATYVSGGNNSSFAILSNSGYVLAWGENAFGDLGDGTTTARSNPDYVLTAPGVRLKNIIQIEGSDKGAFALSKVGVAAGTSFSYAANKPWGYVYAWGGNYNLENGRGTSGVAELYAGLVQADYNNDGTADGPLGGCWQISGGDTHGMAIDTNGRVWAWGGNWGQGQLGNGSGYNNSAFAHLVNAPGNCTSTADRGVAPFMGDVGIPNAVFLAAGQGTSAIVLDNGYIVTFGANFQSGAGGSCNYGTLGQNTNDVTNPTTLSQCPKYVLSGATTTFTGIGNSPIVSVSDGDGWFFARDANGQLYTWGYNSLGTLGDGSTTCRITPVTISLPGGCAIPLPCADKPNLGIDQQVCTGFSQNLLASTQRSTGLRYVWQYSGATTLTGATTWTTLASCTGLACTSITASNYGYYRLLIEDTRGSIASLCGSCPTVGDTIKFSFPPSPSYSAGPSTICTTVSGSGIFSITTTAGGGAYYWYTNASGGVALNTAPGLSISGVSLGSTSTLAGCSGGVLYVQDQSSFSGALIPTPPACTATGSQTYHNSGANYNSMLEIQVNSSLTLNSVDFNLADGNAQSYRLEIYNNSIVSTGNNCASTAHNFVGTSFFNTAYQSYPAGTSGRNVTLTFAGVNLSPGKYWLRIYGGPVIFYNCGRQISGTNFEWTAGSGGPIADNSGNNAVSAIGSMTQYQGNTDCPGGSASTQSHMYNLKFTAGAVSACSRTPVCATATCSALNVTYYSISAEKVTEGALVKWTTISEENSSHFIVERSSDGVVFEQIGKITAKGNSNGWVDYSFLDKKPGRGTVYYRLVQYDFDNSYSISKVVSVSITALADFNVIPNPNNGLFTINAQISTSIDFTIQIANSLGASIFTTRGNSTGYYSKEFDFSSLAAGVYFVSLKAGDDYIVKKVLIE